MPVSPKPPSWTSEAAQRANAEGEGKPVSWWTKRASQLDSDASRPAFARLSVSVLVQFGQPPLLCWDGVVVQAGEQTRRGLGPSMNNQLASRQGHQAPSCRQH